MPELETETETPLEPRGKAKEKVKPIRPRQYPTLYFWVKTYDSLVRVRIANHNRLDALCLICARCKRRILGDSEESQSMTETHPTDAFARTFCACAEPQTILPKAEYKRMGDVIEREMGVSTEVEKIAVREIEAIIPDVSIIYEWLVGLHGIGPIMAAYLIALIDPIAWFPNIGKLWAYGGLDVVDGVGTSGITPNDRKWNRALHALVCYKLPTQFLKARRGFYHDLYREYRAQEDAAHPAPERVTIMVRGESREITRYTAMHLHRRACRRVGKMLLSHLWLRWREFEGLPLTQPYIIGHDGHSHVIAPPESPET